MHSVPGELPCSGQLPWTVTGEVVHVPLPREELYRFCRCFIPHPLPPVVHVCGWGTECIPLVAARRHCVACMSPTRQLCEMTACFLVFAARGGRGTSLGYVCPICGIAFMALTHGRQAV